MLKHVSMISRRPIIVGIGIAPLWKNDFNKKAMLRSLQFAATAL
jgi:hypothetical protein